MMKCDGSCEEHIGTVKKIRLMDGQYGHFDGMEFNYCEAAVECDIKQGFIIQAA